eukprot:TRINITY_DN9030_c0_g1_i1.p1 TRINITY_DN9030_c0_g1~~TRINITY_DN9030_c0_g1_i1.p1  ORF type:complete len:225 (+),score=41.09 TRINITY_DN9030_c0_g1_i1:130-804(+)
MLRRSLLKSVPNVLVSRLPSRTTALIPRFFSSESVSKENVPQTTKAPSETQAVVEPQAESLFSVFDPFFRDPFFVNHPRYMPSEWLDFPRVVSRDMPKVWAPKVDVEESGTAITIHCELPGLNKSDIKVKVEDGVLSISGERKLEKTEENKDKKFKRIERSYGSFKREWTLPDNVDATKISAKSRNGVLEIQIPKIEEKKPVAQEVKIEEDKDEKKEEPQKSST